MLSAQDVSMATLQPGPLQPVWHSQCQLCWPMVHWPFPLHKLGQPSVKGKTGGQKRGGRWEERAKGEKRLGRNSAMFVLYIILRLSLAKKHNDTAIKDRFSWLKIINTWKHTVGIGCLLIYWNQHINYHGHFLNSVCSMTIMLNRAPTNHHSLCYLLLIIQCR